MSKIGPYQAKISGKAVAGLVIEFQQEFRDVYGFDVMASPLCAVGPLQTMIGLAIHKGLLVAPDAYVLMPKCTSWLGHNFKARYSTKLPSFAGCKDPDGAAIIAIIEHAEDKIYEGDVCINCGQVVNRPTPKDPNQ